MAESASLSPEYIAEYEGNRLIAVAAAFIPIIVFFVSLRFYARYLIKAPWALDDTFVLLSLIAQIGNSILAISKEGFVKVGGVGRHFAALELTDPPVIVRYWKILLAVAVYYCICVSLSKLGILAMYWALFRQVKIYRIAIYIISGIVIANAIVCAVVSLTLCRPFAFNWDKSIQGGICLDETLFDQMASLPNIITDVAMLLLPIPVVWKLHTTNRVKLYLMLTLLTGSVGLATSIIRFASFSKGSAVRDGTWASVYLMTWTVIEPDVYLIAACLPTYRPLLARVFKEVSSSSGRGLSYDYASNQRPTPLRPSVNRIGSSTFKRMDSQREVMDGLASDDNIRLVNVERREVNGQAPASLESNEIYVQRTYDVEFGLKIQSNSHNETAS